jgi:hypothetical protein
MGAIMVGIALAMLGNYETRFETAIASGLPSVLVDPSKREARAEVASTAMEHWGPDEPI